MASKFFTIVCLLFWPGRAAATRQSGLKSTFEGIGDAKDEEFWSNLSYLRGWNSGKKMIAFARNLASPVRNLVIKNARSNFRIECRLKLPFLIIKIAPSVSSRKKIKQPSPPESKLNFSVQGKGIAQGHRTKASHKGIAQGIA